MKTIDPLNATILVVDDTAICREPIVEILRGEGYSVLSAANGNDALALLQKHAVDLLLLDVRMPVMDGLAMLRALRCDHGRRELPVIMLTDAAEKSIVLEAGMLGVRGFLLKSHFTISELLSRVAKQLSITPAPSPSAPPPVEQMERIISSPPSAAPTAQSRAASCEIRIRNKNEVVEAIRRHLDLRPFPPVLHQVVSQTNSTGVSIRDVVETLRQDQALSVRVMKVANSSLYTSGKPAQNPVEAAGRIGMSGIRNAVVTAVAIDQFGKGSETRLAPQRFWEHSLAVAALAQSIGERLSVPHVEGWFLAGLLHDLGRLVLNSAFPEEYRAILARVDSEGLALGSLERQTFGLSHAEATKEALSQLRMPPPVVTAASLHDRTAEQLKRSCRTDRGPLIVALADRLAHALAIGDSGDPVLLPFEEHAEALGLDPTAIGDIGRQVAARIADTELFYTSHGEAQLLAPLANELSCKSPHALKVTVMAPDAPNDPVSLYFEQLGWIDAERPDLAVLYQPPGGRPALSEWRSLMATASIPGLMIGSEPVSDLSTATAAGPQHCEFTRLPARYTMLVETCARLSHKARQGSTVGA